MYGEPAYAECGPVARPPEPLGAQPRWAFLPSRTFSLAALACSTAVERWL